MNCVEFKNVFKIYNKRAAVNDLSLPVPEASILFLLGLNGAGKTTFLRLILGLIQPNSGVIKFANPSVSRSIGAVIDSPMFFDGMSAYENLRYYAVAWNCQINRIDEVLKEVGLRESANKKVRTFSTGMKQRLAIARAFLSHPQLLLLDEPMNGLDPAGIAELKEILWQLKETKKVTIVISSHLIEETKSLATHYAILDRGSIVSNFAVSDSERTMMCLRFDSFNTLNSVRSMYPSLWKGQYLSERGYLLFPDTKLVTDLHAFQLQLYSDHQLESNLETATLSEYFLGVTRRSHD